MFGLLTFYSPPPPSLSNWGNFVLVSQKISLRSTVFSWKESKKGQWDLNGGYWSPLLWSTICHLHFTLDYGDMIRKCSCFFSLIFFFGLFVHVYFRWYIHWYRYLMVCQFGLRVNLWSIIEEAGSFMKRPEKSVPPELDFTHMCMIYTDFEGVPEETEFNRPTREILRQRVYFISRKFNGNPNVCKEDSSWLSMNGVKYCHYYYC